MCIPQKLDSVTLPFVSEFKLLYQERFERTGIDWDNYRISVFEFSNDESPLLANRANKIVFFNPTRASELELSQSELMALFAHEIGHLVDSTRTDEDGNGDPSSEREYNADNFALELGLGEYLLSGLIKINEVTTITPTDRLQRIERRLSVN